MSKLNSTMFDGVNRIDRTDVVKFRATLVSHDSRDVHREFSGSYFPRWHAMYIDEVRVINGLPRLNVAYPFDTYQKDDGSPFLAGDFIVGNRIEMSTAPTNQRDDSARTFVITQSDVSRLYNTDLLTATLPLCRGTLYRAVLDNVSEAVVNDLVAIRDAFIRQHGGIVELGLKAVGKQFRSPLDPAGHRLVLASTLEQAATACGVALSKSQIQAIIAAFTPSPTVAGAVRLEDVLEVMRGPMSEDRVFVVRNVFQHLDYDGDGVLSIAEIGAKFAAASHPEVRSGALTADQLRKGFLATWDANNAAGKVSFAEFMDYYSGVSATIVDDAQFEAAVRSAWKIIL
jgi:calcyphosin